MPYLGTFRPEFEKTIFISEISTLEIIKSAFITKKVNFGIGSAFSKGSGYTFSEGQGPLCKVKVASREY